MSDKVPTGSDLSATGERLLTTGYGDNSLEHLHRYGLALQFCSGKRVLDIASGEGYGSGLLAHVAESVTGVDISDETVAHAREKYRRPNLKFLQGAADSIPLPEASCDVVVSFETIEHHDRHDEMMGEIKRVLSSDGMLIISSPDKLNYSEDPQINNPFHVKELYREEFHVLVRKYFANVEGLSQKIFYGSLIAPEDDARGFTHYEGGFEDLTAFAELQRPIYNLCVASDAPLPALPVSLYAGWQVFEAALDSARQNGENAVIQSRAYRIGRALTWPARKLLGHD
ncbi:MAG TPA: class I SAM-dependent methyltransferase [Pyrinomonadaceae bacterium]|nr:class I SAM-dependent methyltransferase [Pyrinomonadaceae bacterium]